MHLRNYALRKMWLGHPSTINIVSEHPSTINMLKGHKDYSNHHKSIFLMLLYHSLLLISKMLGRFANMFAADKKYFLRNSENFQQPIQIQIFKKKNFF